MRDPAHCCLPRRNLLTALAVVPLGAAVPGIAAASDAVRSLSFYHVHTDEQLEVTYFERGAYVEDALTQVDRLLRDFRTGDVARIDPALLDILHLTGKVCERTRLEVISAYRYELHPGRQVRGRVAQQPAPAGARDRCAADRLRHREAAASVRGAGAGRSRVLSGVELRPPGHGPGAGVGASRLTRRKPGSAALHRAWHGAAPGPDYCCAA
jgi:hypothetical protein